MPELVEIDLANLLLDLENPRLAGEYSNQQDAALEMARHQGGRVLALAKDIVDEGGLDPLSPFAVIPTADRRKRYRVIEGNRRLLALKALETPSLVNPALSPSESRRLTQLSNRFAEDPIESVTCALFDTEAEALHWIELRHTGENGGVGLVAWGADEQDRFHARHKGSRSPAGQVLDFVEKHGVLSAEARSSPRGIITTLERVLTTPEARTKLGVDVRKKQVIALASKEALARVLSRVVEDMKTGKIGVPDVYRKEDRKKYVDGLPKKVLPKARERLNEPVVLSDLTVGARAPRTAKTTPPKTTKKKEKQRTTVVPRDAALEVTNPRINEIYNELATLTAEAFPNSASVLLRVFVELSVDHYISANKLMTDHQMRSAKLAKRLKEVATDLESNGKIETQLRRAIDRVADGNSPLAPSVPTMNQYVHNQFVFPRASELVTAWDELEPFLAALWA